MIHYDGDDWMECGDEPPLTAGDTAGAWTVCACLLLGGAVVIWSLL